MFLLNSRQQQMIADEIAFTIQNVSIKLKIKILLIELQVNLQYKMFLLN